MPRHNGQELREMDSNPLIVHIERGGIVGETLGINHKRTRNWRVTNWYEPAERVILAGEPMPVPILEWMRREANRCAGIVCKSFMADIPDRPFYSVWVSWRRQGREGAV
jgi:hypothetical protein